MQSSAKSIKFLPIQGNKVFKENDEIKIKIDAGSAPMINTNNSYLIFSIQIPNCPVYMNPSQFLGGGRIFREMTITDFNEQVQLENITDLHLLESIAAYYGENENDKNIRGIFNGRCPNIAEVFHESTDFTVPTNNSRGGGTISQYYQKSPAVAGGTASVNSDLSRKVQVLYRFNLSGILNPYRTENWANILTQGITIRLRLLPAHKLLVPRQIRSQATAAAGDVTARPAFDGGMGQIEKLETRDMGNGTEEQVGTNGRRQTIAVEGSATAFNDPRVYAIRGFVDAAGAQQLGQDPIPNNPGVAIVPISGLILANPTDGSAEYVNKFRTADLNNCLFKVGGKVRIAKRAGGNFTAAECFGSQNGMTEKIAEVRVRTGRIELLFENNVTVTDRIALGTPIIPDLNDINISYEVTDVQYTAEVVSMPPQYLEQLVQRFNSGKTVIQYRTYDDYKINIPSGATQTELYIPADNTRAFAFLNYNERLIGEAPQVDNLLPPNYVNQTAAGAFLDGIQGLEYQFNINGNLVPQLPVSLESVCRSDDIKGVSVLAQIELEKALMATSIPIKNLLHVGNCLVIGRGLGRDGSTFNLKENDMRLRVNYRHQNQNILTHNVVYSVRVLRVVNGSRVVVR